MILTVEFLFAFLTNSLVSFGQMYRRMYVEIGFRTESQMTLRARDIKTGYFT